VGVGVGVYVAIGELEGRAEQITEASIGLTAVAVLTWMIFWMRRQARTLGAELRGSVDHALASGAVLGLASITFLGVLREGIETSLFLLAVIFDAGAGDTAVGAFAGLAGATAIGYAFYRGGQFVNLRLFFQITGGLIILFAAGLFGKAVFQLQAIGLFDSYYFPVWDLTGHTLLGTSQFAAFMRGLFGWSAQPSIEQVVVWAAFVGSAAWFFYFGHVPASVSERVNRAYSAIARGATALVGRPLNTEADITQQD
jgi:high-affinity iron transporter